MRYRNVIAEEFERLRDGVLVVDGYGIRLAVERGNLVVVGGLATERWELRLTRVDRRLKRVVVRGHAGHVTLDAIEWLNGVGVPLMHIGVDGTLFGVMAPASTQHAKVRRAQVLAPELGHGFRIVRELVRDKMFGQLNVLESLPESANERGTIQGILNNLDSVTTSSSLRIEESNAAKAYWFAWRNIPVRWRAKEQLRRPPHWSRFGRRASPLSGFDPRRAVNPANAILNYLYAILEAEAQVACLSVGLDPGLGFLHTDKVSRASLALDVMEPIRPHVDQWALNLFKSREFRASDAMELRDGHCRLLPPLAAMLSRSAKRWAPLVLEVAIRVVRQLQEVDGDNTPRSPRGRRRPQWTVAKEYRSLQPSGGQRGSGRTDQRKSESVARVAAADREWEGSNPGKRDPAEFVADILPGLRGVRLDDLMAATGLTRSACCQIRQGRMVPHQRHWSALARITS